MFNLAQIIWFLASSLHTATNNEPIAPPKSIFVVGAGSAGIGALKALLDLPSDVRLNWNITLYEQCGDVAGIWLPDPRPAFPPNIPDTPLYPLLHTNTPIPSMTYPGFPFPPGTPLYPSHEHVRAYHRLFAEGNDLISYIKFHHTVVSTNWVGRPDQGFWNVTLLDHLNRTLEAKADHLIVATGNDHFPRQPSWKGQEDWLQGGRGKREILHSIYYRGPERYSNRTLLVIGGGASGQDAATQTVHISRRTYISLRHEPLIAPPQGWDEVIVKPDISHFTRDSIVFRDGTELVDVDDVLLATGYEQRKPFLEAGGALIADPSARSRSSSSSRGGTLVTNSQYIFPLHRHILSLSPEYPVNALAFIGLPTRIANCPSDFAQGSFIAHAVANPSILPSRDELLDELTQREEDTRRLGFDPYVIGHAMVPGGASSSDYQDNLIEFLKQQKAIPENGKKYVEGWRRRIFTYEYMKRGWKRIEALGESDKWLNGVETEQQWSDLMYRVNAWQERWERDNGIQFVHDLVVGG